MTPTQTHSVPRSDIILLFDIMNHNKDKLINMKIHTDVNGFIVRYMA